MWGSSSANGKLILFIVFLSEPSLWWWWSNYICCWWPQHVVKPWNKYSKSNLSQDFRFLYQHTAAVAYSTVSCDIMNEKWNVEWCKFTVQEISADTDNVPIHTCWSTFFVNWWKYKNTPCFMLNDSIGFDTYITMNMDGQIFI